MSLNSVELFAGGGGLAHGLKAAGVVPRAAVELEGYAASTFRLNHPDVVVFESDVRDVSAKEIMDACAGGVDVLAACPPCQGFSSLTSKYRKNDERNELVLEVASLAASLRPKAIMFENVPGLAKRGKHLFEKLISALEADGYAVTWKILQVADYGVPQFRRRLVLLAGRGFSISIPRASHDEHGRLGLPRWRTVRDALTVDFSPQPISEARKAGGFESLDWHVVRDLGEANLMRLRYARPGAMRSRIPDHLRPKCHQGKDSGFANVYGRMEWDRPSPTITAGCLSPSKGRFGHPEDLRTISLREAALLQTFPKHHKFPDDRIDLACSVIGNALPSLFAQAIAVRVAEVLRRAQPWLDPPRESD